MNRTDLLRAVLADPSDDHARLVYADWLDDHDERERAEFIRVHVQRGLGPFVGNPGKAMTFSYVADIRCYVRAAEVGSVVVAPAYPGVSLVCCRGFISGLRGPLAALLEHGPRIVAEHPVERVDVTDRKTFRSGGNDTYYIGGYDPMPLHTWKYLDNHRTPKGAMNALNDAVLREIRRRVKEITQGFSV